MFSLIFQDTVVVLVGDRLRLAVAPPTALFLLPASTEHFTLSPFLFAPNPARPSALPPHLSLSLMADNNRAPL